MAFFVVLAIRLTHAEESYAPPKPDETPAADAAKSDATDMLAKESAGGSGTPQGQQTQVKPAQGQAQGQTFDPAVVSAGQSAFEQSCTTCHDAARSLERSKDLAGWRATVRRMAAKSGAEVASSDLEPIAVYLASRSAPASGGQTAGTAEKSGAAADQSSVSTFATLSPMFRGGNDHIQNPDFAPLAFFGASWQSNVVSARITLCITCHGVQEPGNTSRVDPLEVAVHWDLSQYLDCHLEGMKGGIDAGRFVVPFGAFSAQVNPGLYHTVSPPLIFNMGERIYNLDLGYPVLPMPDADEGVDLNLSVPLGCGWSGPITATMDAYLVNGLEGNNTGIDFIQTRSLMDNNNRLSSGGRITIGEPNIRAGASLTGGRFDDPTTSTVPGGLDYTIYGFDVQAHYERLLRFQFEFARRDSERVGFFPTGPAEFGEVVQWYYAELEARHCNDSHVSVLVRYDSQSHRSLLPPTTSTLPSGRFDVERLTLGVNFELWRQSLLMIDLEHWLLPEPNKRIANIGGVRYTITF
ncbi:MAG TPA: hypothetical protein VGH32_07250 [Pirellulales bacterium]